MIFYYLTVIEGGGEWIPHFLLGSAPISNSRVPPLTSSSWDIQVLSKGDSFNVADCIYLFTEELLFA